MGVGGEGIIIIFAKNIDVINVQRYGDETGIEV